MRKAGDLTLTTLWLFCLLPTVRGNLLWHIFLACEKKHEHLTEILALMERMYRTIPKVRNEVGSLEPWVNNANHSANLTLSSVVTLLCSKLHLAVSECHVDTTGESKWLYISCFAKRDLRESPGYWRTEIFHLFHWLWVCLAPRYVCTVWYDVGLFYGLTHSGLHF